MMSFKRQLLLSIVCNFCICGYFMGRTEKVFVFDGYPLGCDQTQVREISHFTTLYNRYISILEDTRGKKFVLKQEVRDTPFLQLSVARDKLGAIVAWSAHVPANLVEIIPSYCKFPGKRYVQFPATLHSFVRGVLVKFLPKHLKSEFKLYIQQKDGIGLTRDVIGAMSNHEDLCKIVALDTFIANADRHQGNFFYDQESNRYCAIDLESAFDKNLARYACHCINSLGNKKYQNLSDKEWRGLKVYRDVLKQLIYDHTPESLHGRLVQFSLDAGVSLGAHRLSVGQKLEQYKMHIKENYESCKELVSLIDALLKKYKK